ncbi:MAG: alkane 1-monooxygenase [Bacteroidota bacterium]
MWKDIKYLFAYIAPATAFAGIYFGGYWSLGAIYVGFVFIPLMELFTPQFTDNIPEADEQTRAGNFFFDLLLYLNIPMIYVLLWYAYSSIAAGGMETYEIVNTILSVGLIAGTVGINVAHELGHRPEWYNQLAAKALLLTALYMHFIIEHNRGHHKNVATDADPASAKYGETVYAFWLRSTVGSYFNAWRLEQERLSRKGQSALSLRNEMIWFQLIQLAYLLTVGLLFGWLMIPVAIGIAVFGFLLLESVNYIEHYGLRRKQLPSGRYENVSPQHSWNSDHELGRIFLYELTRHSDHHFKATRKYQVLRHFDESPQLPFGYPGSILMSMVPPLWFKVMNKKVQQYHQVA